MTKRVHMWATAMVAMLLGASTPGGVFVVSAAEDDLAGIVTSGNGREAGVWVVAETDDFDTTFRKIVVTDDEGRFLVPDLPQASYEVWVRGYGLVDSDRTLARPGDQLDLMATVTTDPGKMPSRALWTSAAKRVMFEYSPGFKFTVVVFSYPSAMAGNAPPAVRFRKNPLKVPRRFVGDVNVRSELPPQAVVSCKRLGFQEATKAP